MNALQKEAPRSAEFPPPAGASTAPASINVRRRIAAPAQAYMAQAHVGGWTSALEKLAARAERKESGHGEPA